MVLKALTLAFAMLSFSCGAGVPATPRVPHILVLGASGQTVDLTRSAGTAPATVLIFFSPHCHCLDVHEGRLRSLYADFHPRGVEFFMVDSEAAGSRERDDREARDRGYPFPIVLDRGAALANAVDAQYATYSVLIDGHGRIRYRGGIDGDKTHLHEDAPMFLRDAIVAVLAGKEPRLATGKTLGCSLEKW